MILLDTSFLIDYFRGIKQTKDLVDDDVVVTTISYHEIMTGIRHKKAAAEERFFTRFFGEVPLLAFDKDAAGSSSEIGAKILAIGKMVNTLNIMIAGTAVAHGVRKIITRDTDFLEIAKVADIDVIIY